MIKAVCRTNDNWKIWRMMNVLKRIESSWNVIFVKRDLVSSSNNRTFVASYASKIPPDRWQSLFECQSLFNSDSSKSPSLPYWHLPCMVNLDDLLLTANDNMLEKSSEVWIPAVNHCSGRFSVGYCRAIIWCHIHHPNLLTLPVYCTWCATVKRLQLNKSNASTRFE